MFLEKLFKKRPQVISHTQQVTDGIPIDHTTPLNPSVFGKLEGWTIDEEDRRSLTLDHVDLQSVRLVSMLKEGEAAITGEERLRRLKDTSFIRLDSKVLQATWNHRHLVPASWVLQTDGLTTCVFFDGTVFRSPDGDRCVLCIGWRPGKREFEVEFGRLDEDFGIADLSAVLRETQYGRLGLSKTRYARSLGGLSL